ncbi:MAG: hypothetical protein VZS44_09390 [Bacilli bacterium]|nr:hypothetical protein [Bacilli bacterium]
MKSEIISLETAKKIEELERENKHLHEVNCKLRKNIEIHKEENKKLKEKIEHLLIDLDGESEYKLINEKAIEYIEKYVSYYDMEGDLRDRLLDILKGDNK